MDNFKNVNYIGNIFPIEQIGSALMPVSQQNSTQLELEASMAEQRGFQLAFQHLQQSMFGVGVINLVAPTTDGIMAYSKYLQIGARFYPSCKERHRAILRELSIAEYYQAMKYGKGEGEHGN